MEQVLMNIIEADNISFGYDRPLLSNVSFDVKDNSITGVIGVNGAGKTTLFDLLCRIRKPDRGILKVHTADPAYLSQTLTTSPALKLGDLFTMISMLGSKSGLTLADATAMLGDWNTALACRFERLSQRRSTHCSYGEIRYYFALSLLVLPNELVLMDEPTAGVDPEHRYYIWQAIHAAKSAGKTVIVSSHNLQEITQHTEVFWLIGAQKMTRFSNEMEFLSRFEADDLDQAFMNANRQN